MPVSKYPVGSSGNAIDITKMTEHQAIINSVSSTSLTTLLSVSGKGCLEEAVLFAGGSTVTLSSAIEIIITIDGVVVLDITNTYPTNTVNSIWGLVSLNRHTMVTSNTIGSTGMEFDGTTTFAMMSNNKVAF